MLAEAFKHVPVTHLYCSPFLRALQTAAPVAQVLGKTPLVHSRIYEQGGCYRGFRIGERQSEAGLGRSKILELFPAWEIDPAIQEQGWNKHLSYETKDEARQRGIEVANWINEQSWPANTRLVMIIHADFKLRLLEAFLARNDIEERFGPVINTAFTTLTKREGSWKLDCWNVHEHLGQSYISS